MEVQSTTQYRLSRDWRKSGGITKKNIFGLENQQRYWGGQSKLVSAEGSIGGTTVFKILPDSAMTAMTVSEGCSSGSCVYNFLFRKGEIVSGCHKYLLLIYKLRRSSNLEQRLRQQLKPLRCTWRSLTRVISQSYLLFYQIVYCLCRKRNRQQLVSMPLPLNWVTIHKPDYL